VIQNVLPELLVVVGGVAQHQILQITCSAK
jgi:hypothetical protein